MKTTPLFNSWVRCPKPNPQARLRLFCFPYAGGSVSIFRTWSEEVLPVEIEVCPIQLPGRESRLQEPPFTQLSRLLETLAQVMHPYLNMPFAFFGHSMGALISFELARQLRRQYSLNPVHLFVSGRAAPQIPISDSSIHQLPESEFIEKLRYLNGTPESVLKNPELMHLLLPILRADFAVCETYVYSNEEPLDCPISTFGGLQDDEVSYEDIAAWRELTNSSCTLRMFPGNHFFLHSNQALIWSAVSQDIRQHLIK
ncbi:thioesterase II family protein [Nostoc sp.]|uniref:thioesterase II family protein n=1 Tax=Nostoc sp. TaxID=1180 RepID=UPI002FF6DDAE